MAKRLKKKVAKGGAKKKPIAQYEHKDKQRINNPPVGLVNPDTDPDVLVLSDGLFLCPSPGIAFRRIFPTLSKETRGGESVISSLPE